MTRYSGTPHKKITPPVMAPDPVCRGCSKIVIDGLPCSATSPSCPVHGFEAGMLAMRQYIAEPTPEEPIVWRGREQ